MLICIYSHFCFFLILFFRIKKKVHLHFNPYNIRGKYSLVLLGWGTLKTYIYIHILDFLNENDYPWNKLRQTASHYAQ